MIPLSKFEEIATGDWYSHLEDGSLKRRVDIVLWLQKKVVAGKPHMKITTFKKKYNQSVRVLRKLRFYKEFDPDTDYLK